ncbi:unnamed protein product [Prorocentrum cordatum]|uniref:Uncharacterized protein n=1 Tax=Prorocentrum cordatum TaxID=2364126 RepID=A0ABN9Y4Y1_9DINO|nr:unnamed protein product [Polarella glacialis]
METSLVIEVEASPMAKRLSTMNQTEQDVDAALRGAEGYCQEAVDFQDYMQKEAEAELKAIREENENHAADEFEQRQRQQAEDIQSHHASMMHDVTNDEGRYYNDRGLTTEWANTSVHIALQKKMTSEDISFGKLL